MIVFKKKGRGQEERKMGIPGSVSEATRHTGAD
jgi:hypothetical protein